MRSSARTVFRRCGQRFEIHGQTIGKTDGPTGEDLARIERLERGGPEGACGARDGQVVRTVYARLEQRQAGQGEPRFQASTSSAPLGLVCQAVGGRAGYGGDQCDALQGHVLPGLKELTAKFAATGLDNLLEVLQCMEQCISYMVVIVPKGPKKE